MIHLDKYPAAFLGGIVAGEEVEYLESVGLAFQEVISSLSRLTCLIISFVA